jgi:5-formyltetrahydrofolate cyclo-ligase
MSNYDLKRELRHALRQKRRDWSGVDRAIAEEKICAAICETSHIQHAEWIGVYLAFDGEVDLSRLWGGGRPIFNHDLESSRSSLIQTTSMIEQESILYSKLVFPRHQSKSPLSFVRPHRWVGQGALPLPEGPEVPLEDIDVLLIPGVAFSPTQGARLGLGGGHYDRTLALGVNKSWSVKAFGVGFCFQQHPQLPLDTWDAKLDGVFTELGLLEPY